jgi:PIN domain
MHGLALAAEYDEALERLSQVRNRLAAEATIKSRTFELVVDQRLSKLTEIASKYPDDDEVFERAIRRAQKGNPPGKKESIGDQYNWEMLLKKVPDVDLYVVSKDGDYASPLGGTDANGAIYPNVFLSNEWKTARNGKNLYLFSSIKDVLKHFEKTFANEGLPRVEAVESQVRPAQPAIAEAPQAQPVAAEPVRVRRTHEGAEIRDAETISAIDNAVDALVNSSSFYETHQAVGALGTMLHLLGIEDAERLVSAAIDNNQIGWIVSDPDVRDFYQNLVNIFLLELDGGLLDALLEKMGLLDESDSDTDEEPLW